MTVVPLPEQQVLWIMKQAFGLLVKDGGTSVFFSLESGTVESHCSQGGVTDVTAARHTKDLQLVAPSTQTHQAFISYLLEATEVEEKLQQHGGRRTCIIISLPLLQPNVCLTVHDCILMVVSSGQCFWRCFNAPSSSWIKIERMHSIVNTPGHFLCWWEKPLFNYPIVFVQARKIDETMVTK